MAKVLLIPRIPATKMMKLLAVADVVLDTWPYGGAYLSCLHSDDAPFF